MLNNEQCKILARYAELKIISDNGLMCSVGEADKNALIKIRLEEFVDRMQLEPMRLSWLLGNNNYIAGGAVLNWILQENKNEDIDFFVKDEEAANMFISFILGLGFVFSSNSGYATTFFNSETGLILQVIRRFMGSPERIISTFDINLCKFAIDADHLYTQRYAVLDLLSNMIRINDNHTTKFNILDRVLKYQRKGFFIPNSLRKRLYYKEPVKEISKHPVVGPWY